MKKPQTTTHIYFFYMRLTHFYVLFGILISPIFGLGTDDLGNLPGCKVSDSSTLNDGFKGNIYYHPWVKFVGNNSADNSAMTDNTDAYLNGGYAANDNLITYSHTNYTLPGYVAKDVTATDVSFNNTDFCKDYNSGTCFNEELWTTLDNFKDSSGNSIFLPITNLIFHMVGVMVPAKTGTYVLHLNYIDDMGIISVGSGIHGSADCCSNFDASGETTVDASISSSWTADGRTGTNIFEMSLIKGVAYPISVFYMNVGGLGGISLTYTDPSGTNHSDFGGFVYNKADTSQCTYATISTSTLPWTGSTTSYSTTSSATTTFLTNSATPSIIYTEEVDDIT